MEILLCHIKDYNNNHIQRRTMENVVSRRKTPLEMVIQTFYQGDI
jgi:hypothetical protein